MPLNKAAQAIRRKIEDGQQEQLQQGIPADRIKNQLPPSAIPPGSGGGLPALNEGDLIYGDSGGAVATLPIGDPGYMLYSNGSAPIWDVQPPPSGAATGDLDGTYPAPIVDGIQGRTVIDVDPNDLDVLTWNAGGNYWEPAAPTGGGGGGTPSHAYYDRLCALLEPDAIEPFQQDSFSYAIGGSVTKYVLASFNTRLGASGRWEVRDPRQPVPLRGVTLTGLAGGASALILDPSLPTYADSWTTYHDRLEAIATMQTRYVPIAGTVPFLTGAYGAILLQVTNFDYTWVIGRYNNGVGYNLANEIDDSNTQRNANALMLPLSKNVICELANGAGSGAAGAIFVLLPSSWSAIADPNTYDFRDDFMGATLDTGSDWTRAQSTSGNVEISTTFQWLGMIGNGNWGDNGIYSQSSVARAAGKVFVCDVFIPNGSGSPNLVVGWSTGAGQSYSDFAHMIDFTGGALQVFENGNSRGAVGSGYTASVIYRVRITLGASSATYEIQGGAYAAFGSASWSNITPGVSSSSSTPLHAGATINSAVQVYVSDMRVY